MLAFFDPEQFKHEPKFSLFSGVPKPNSEVSERAKVLRDALLQHGHELKIPKPHGIIPVEAVHHQDYLHFLKNIYRRWQEIPGASPEVIPKNNLAVLLSGLESNFYGGSDSTISLSPMNTNRCATVRANPIPWMTQFIIISLTARSIITSSTGVAAH